MLKKQVTQKKKDIGFDDLNNKLDRVIDAIVGMEARLNHKIEEVDVTHTSKFNEVLVAVDGFTSRFERMELDSVHIHHRLDRHEEWAKIFAGKLTVKLSY